MIKRYSAPRALGLGDMTPRMSKKQKDAIDRATDAKIEAHFRTYQPLPNGRNFHTWNHRKDIAADDRYRDNFDSIFPNAPGAGM